MDDSTKLVLSDIMDLLEDSRTSVTALGNRLDAAMAKINEVITGTTGPADTFQVASGIVTNTSASVFWPAYPGADSYLVGRDGVDRNNYGSWATQVLATDPRALTFQNLLAQTDYRVSVVPYVGGHQLAAGATITVRTSADPIVVTPPSSPGKLPVVGRSTLGKLGSNVVLFRSGVDDLNGLANWESQNGRVDGLMRFVPRLNESEFLAPSFWDQMGQVAATGRVTVIAFPWAPESAGKGMNTAVSQGAFDAFHGKVAALILKYGLNRSNVVLRMSWEYNSTGGDGWYLWSTVNGGLDTWKKAWARTVGNFRKAGVDKALWDQTANKGPQSNNGTSGADAFVDGCVDIVGVDHYAMWPAQTTTSSFNDAVNQVPGLASQRALAKAKGVQWSIPECGPVNPADKDHGGDSTAYAASMLGYVNQYAPSGMAYMTIYDDGGAPATFDHTLASNPNWRTAVRAMLRQ